MINKKFSKDSKCHCGSGKKYNNCCLGVIDWEKISNRFDDDDNRMLTISERNIKFIYKIFEALQLDKLDDSEIRKVNIEYIKKALTPNAVRELHEENMKIWSSKEDLEFSMGKRDMSLSGLYVGSYDYKSIIKGINRHSLYNENILLIDPFLSPMNMTDEYNPIINPGIYRSSTMKWIMLWLGLAPWVKSGMLKFIKTPGYYDLDLELETTRLTAKRHEANPELENIIKEMPLVEMVKLAGGDDMFLKYLSEEEIVDSMREKKPNVSDTEINKTIDHIDKLKKNDPYYFKPIKLKDGNMGEIIHSTLGANYDMAKNTALLSGSYLITDINYRWQEIIIDRKNANIKDSSWSPFAKAIHEIELPFLDNVSIDVALKLRQEGKLKDIRSFLVKVWQKTMSDEPYSPDNVKYLEAELNDKVREAKVEWEKIDLNLLKRLGRDITLTIGSGQPEWCAPIFAASQLVSLGIARKQRRKFALEFPAGFFLNLKS